jgi:hypothetical protein
MIKTDSSYTHTKNATRPWRIITISVGRGGGVANPPCRCTEQAGGGGVSGDAARWGRRRLPGFSLSAVVLT